MTISSTISFVVKLGLLNTKFSIKYSWIPAKFLLIKNICSAVKDLTIFSIISSLRIIFLRFNSSLTTCSNLALSWCKLLLYLDVNISVSIFFILLKNCASLSFGSLSRKLIRQVFKTFNPSLYFKRFSLKSIILPVEFLLLCFLQSN